MKPGVVSLVLAILVSLYPAKVTAQETETRSKIRQVAEFAEDTPTNEGYLAVAEKEAAVALQHAALAVSDPDNLASIKVHTRHVLHAISPRSVEDLDEPGLGHGLADAIGWALEHMDEVAAALDATDEVRLHAGHLVATLTGLIDWIAAVNFETFVLLKEDDLDTAIEGAREVLQLVGHISIGVDANRDGTISWHEGEGGLPHAREHLDLLLEATRPN